MEAYYRRDTKLNFSIYLNVLFIYHSSEMWFSSLKSGNVKVQAFKLIIVIYVQHDNLFVKFKCIWSVHQLIRFITCE